MEGKVYGIDLGTTYSCIATVPTEGGEAKIIKNAEGTNTTPSVVYFESDSNVVVGDTAKDNVIMDPEKTVSFVKRHIGRNDEFSFEYNGQNLTPEEVSAYILKKLVTDAEAQLGEKIENVVITHPAYFGINEKQATKNAGIIAGLNVVSLIDEPVAAAYSYSCDSDENNGKTVLVYDLGGGTFDVTLIKIDEKEVKVICTGGDCNLGGYNWDERLIEHLVARFCEATGASEDELFDDPEMRAVLQAKAEKMKKELSSKEISKTSIKADSGAAKIEVTRDEFNSITADLCERTIMLTNDMIEEAKAKATREGFEFNGFDTILLVGGSTKMDQIREAVYKEFGIEPISYEQDEAVAKGAALYGVTVLNTPDEPVWPDIPVGPSVDPQIGIIHGKGITTVTSKSFGIKVSNDAGEEYISNIILKNTPLPADYTKRFRTGYDNQGEALLELYETEVNEERAELMMGVVIGEATLKLPPNTPKDTPIEVNFKINDQGLLEFTGRELTSNIECSGIVDVKNGLTQQQIEESIKRMQNTLVE